MEKITRRQLLVECPKAMAALLAAGIAGSETVKTETPVSWPVFPLVESPELPPLSVTPVGPWEPSLRDPQKVRGLMAVGAVAGLTVEKMLELVLSRAQFNRVLAAATGSLGFKAAPDFAAWLATAIIQEPDPGKQRLLVEAPQTCLERYLAVQEGQRARECRSKDCVPMCLGEPKRLPIPTGGLFTFPIHATGSEKPGNLTLFLADHGKVPELGLASELDPALLTASLPEFLWLARKLVGQSLGGVETAAISHTHKLVVQAQRLPCLPSDLSTLYASTGLTITTRGSQNPYVWDHAENLLDGTRTASLTEFNPRSNDPNQNAVLFNLNGWELTGQAELVEIARRRKFPPGVTGLFLPQYAFSHFSKEEMAFPFSSQRDMGLSFAFRAVIDGNLRYGLAAASQWMLFHPGEMKNLITATMETLNASDWQVFCTDLGGQSGFGYLSGEKVIEPSKGTVINLERGGPAPPPPGYSGHTGYGYLTFS